MGQDIAGRILGAGQGDGQQGRRIGPQPPGPTPWGG